jgi:hypothetical protein
MNRGSAIGLLSRLRRLRLPLGRGALAVFAATWLGLAVQPCMADAVPADGTAEPAPMERHAGGCGGEAAPERQSAPAHDCPHCPPGGMNAGECSTALACTSIGVPAMVSKAGEPPRADFGAWIDLPVPPGGASPPSRAPGAAVAAQRVPRAPPRPLQQRFCSYLK